MHRFLHRIIAVAVLALGLVTLPAQASRQTHEPGVLVVNDGAKLFSTEGIEQAKKVLHDTMFDHGLFVRIDTLEHPTDNKKAAAEAAQHDRVKWRDFMAEWVKERAIAEKPEGVYVLICRHPGGVAVIADRQTRERGFSDADESKLREILTKGLADSFDNGKDRPDGQATRDAGLKAGAEYVVTKLKGTTVADQDAKATGTKTGRQTGGGSNLMGYVCLGLVGLMGAWLVIGIIRALSGGGAGAGGTGSGGGFFTSLLGGLFGAAAGMWLYSHFFGGGSMFGGGSDAYAGDGSGGDYGDSGAGDYGGESGSGGGFFDGGGGGDFGGGDF